MTVSSQLRFGIIGTNFITDRMMGALSSLGIPVTAVCSRTAARGEEYARRYAIPSSFTDFEAFLASGINALYIATPNLLHSEQTEMALRAGLHVLCEKPVALTADAFRTSLGLANERSLVLLEAMRPYYDPFVFKVRELLPRLGRIRRASFDFCQYSSRYDAFRAGEVKNAFDPTLGNAALMDIGVYCLSLAVLFFGEPESVVSRSVFLPNGMEGAGSAILGYSDLTVDIRYSKIADSLYPSYFQGEDATLSFDHPVSPRTLILHPRGGEEERFDLPVADNNMIYEVSEFCRLVASGASYEAHSARSLAVLRLMDEIRRQNGIAFQ